MKIVLAHGVFDLLHYGHLKHLQAAKRLGDLLIVSITADAYVTKGPGRPIFTQDKRKEMLLGLRCVDTVLISDAPTPERIIRAVMPAVYVKGKEYEGRLPEQIIVESLGGRVVFTDEVVYSSSELVKHL